MSAALGHVLENARHAVAFDPVCTAAESAERWASRRIWRAVVLSRTLEVCEALFAGEAVPTDALDPEWARRFGLIEQGGRGVSVAIRLDEVPSIAATAPGVPRVRLDDAQPREPALEEEAA